MRASIVAWSTLSGAILGLFLDATAVGLVLLLSSLIPAGAIARLHSRWLTVVAIVVLVAVPVVLSILGYLEGELKAA